MELPELKKALDEARISPNVYSLVGGYPSEQYCIEENYGRWAVYYSERGRRSGEKVFYSEDTACDYFYNLLLKDPTTRKK